MEFPLDDRYRTDVTFHTLVDRFQVLIRECEADGLATPHELRTALTYACMLREMRRNGQRYIYDPATGELRNYFP